MGAAAVIAGQTMEGSWEQESCDPLPAWSCRLHSSLLTQASLLPSQEEGWGGRHDHTKPAMLLFLTAKVKSPGVLCKGEEVQIAPTASVQRS